MALKSVLRQTRIQPAGISPPAGTADRTTLMTMPKVAWQTIALLAVLAGSTFLNLWHLTRNGYGNDYYAAAVRSMSSSWHNFFYNAFDPGGWITVDKPPVALWIQALSARVFGYSGFSILMPEALAGVGSVLLVYLSISRVFGKNAGLIGALATATTPVLVAVNRSNNLDAWLVFFVTGAAYAMVRALEKGNLRWLLFSAVLMGVAFNTKFLAAYVALPALWAAYFVATPVSFKTRIGHLVAATAALAVVSASWVLAFDLTPAADRPYAGGSSTNSMLNLLIEYNGLGRIEGQSGPQSGVAGPFRLFESALAGDASWLVPLAVIGGLAALLMAGRKLSGNQRLGSVVLWGGWLLTAGVTFSFAKGIFHDYYLSFLAPAIGAMVGIAYASFSESFSKRSPFLLLAPIALIATAALEVKIIGYTPNPESWLVPAIVAGVVVSVAALVAATFVKRVPGRVGGMALAVGIIALMLPPAVWSKTLLGSTGNGTLPTAVRGNIGSGFGGGNRGAPGGDGTQGFQREDGAGGQLPEGMELPEGMTPPTDGNTQGERPAFNDGTQPGATDGQAAQGDTMPGGGGMGGGSLSTALLDYLRANHGDVKWLVAVQSSQQASGVIIETGDSIMAMGGFSGSDPAMTVERLAELVESGELRFVLSGGGGGMGGGNNSINAVIQKVGKTVDASEYGGTSNGALYDLQGLADALRAGANS